MLKSILTAAVGWIHRGLPLRLLKIVIFAPTAATMARSQFAAIRQVYLAPHGFVERAEKELQASSGWDVFLSYCHTDEEPARLILTSLQARLPAVRVFFDRVNIQKGASWLLHVAESLDYAKRVVALYTPHYWTSPNCKDEFAAALARQNDTGTTVLFPIYLLTAPIPYLFRNLQFADCREGDREKVRFACGTLASEIRNC